MTGRDYTAEELTLATAAWNRTEDDLILDLGVALAGPGESRDGDPDDLRGRVSNWFDRNLAELRQRLCGNPNLDGLTDAAVEVATIADTIASITGKPAAYTVAAIILKRGTHWLCG